MGNEELIENLKVAFPNLECAQGNDWPEFSFEATSLLEIVNFLKNEPNLLFDYLFCETCVDWKTHFTMVYHLSSTKFRHNLVLKAKVNRDQPEIETLAKTYSTAYLHEREIFDLFGVIFTNHPDLRRILLTEEWVGHPLRKDYEDPINMIKL